MVNWQQRYATGDTPWDRGGGHPALTTALAASPMSGRVLVPGCGYGYDMQEILLQSPQHGGEIESITGIDIADTAVTEAQIKLSAFPQATVEKADLFALPKSHWMRYHWVWEHTCFCAIDPSLRNAYVDAVANCLRPGGHLLACFYLRPWDTEEENKTKGPPYGTTAEELDRRFAPRFEILKVWDPPATYPGREGGEQLRLLRKS
jgi:methyl halide transferase